MSAIKIIGLRKIYSVGFLRKAEKIALCNLSLEVAEGEIFGYLGPNGAGKTTTLKILMGLMSPTAGSVKIWGQDIHNPDVKRSIGFLPEQPYFYDYLTAQELLEYFAQLSGVAAKERTPRARKMLEKVGLGRSAHTQLRKLSKGMLQRVGIAQSIIHDPKIVFMDEPMSGLDPVGRREVRDLIQELHEDGKTIFFSTHILSDAETLCDRVAVLHLGELRSVGVVADLLSNAHGKMEIVWEGSPDALREFAETSKTAGKLTRAVVHESDSSAAIDAIRRSLGKLVSMNAMRGSLEEYFLSHVNPSRNDSGSQGMESTSQ